MASPFRVFRKNVKPMLAIITVLLILAWLGGGALTSIMGGSDGGARSAGGDARAVAVRWDGGSLTNQEVNNLVMRRRLLNSFLQQVEMGGARTAYEAGVEPSELRVQRLLGPDTPQQGIEQSVVETKLLADAARQAGMRVSDATIVQYLDQLGRGRVTRPDMRKILNGMGSHTRLSIDDIMGALREEMLAHNYINSNQYAFGTVTPEQRWKDWLRVNDRVVIEAAAIPAESFLVDVKEPTEAELQAFFEKKDDRGTKYSERESSPELVGTTELPSPTPGFRIPRKIDVQFIEANYDIFLANAEERVTDEEIAKYYEAHKDPMFVKAAMDLMEDKGQQKETTKPENGAAPDAKGASDSRPSEEPAMPPAAESKEAPAEGKATTDEEKPAAPDDVQPPAKDGDEDAAAKDGKQSSLHVRSKTPFRLAAFLQDAEQGDAAKADASKSDDPAATEAKSTDAPDKPAETTPPPTTTPPAAAPATTPPAPKKPLEFQPLDEVKDIIRRRLAEDKVAEELTKLTRDIQGALDVDSSTYLGEILAAHEDKKEPPAPPKSLTDLAPLAEKYGLKTGTTGPMSVLQMRDTPVGKSAVVDLNKSLIGMLFFSRDADLYQPFTTTDIDGNRFIVLKTSDTPGRIPALADVRDEVVKAWKANQAADLAEKHAQELAKKAQEAKTPLPAFFADDKNIKVVRTDPFSELTGGDVGYANGQLQRQPYRLSQPDGITAPGPDFMKEVFQLKDGQVGVALNHDHTIAYVIRLVEHQPPLNDLRSEYLAEANTWPGLGTMIQGHAQEVASSLVADITKNSNLKWQRDKDMEKQGQDQSAPEDERSSGG